MSDLTTPAMLEVVDEGKLPISVASTYLRLYVAEIDWDPHIKVLYERMKRHYSDEALAEMMRKVLSCTILLRAFQPSVPLDVSNPETLLFSVHKFHQFGEKEWFKQFQGVVKFDLEVQEWRRQALEIGVVDRIEFAMYPRQAFNWIFDKAQEGGWVNDSNREILKVRFRRLVQAYGGMVICNIFTRHQEAIARVLNWRSGYFLERQIFKVYTPDQVCKIKALELEKTNSTLVKKVTYTR